VEVHAEYVMDLRKELEMEAFPETDATTSGASGLAPATPPPAATLTALPHPDLRKLFDRQGDEPFDDDREYLRSLEADIEILGLGRETREAFQRRCFKAKLEPPRPSRAPAPCSRR